MSFTGLIFDLDGTLWDCSHASADGFNLAYETFGIPRNVDADFVKSISGKPTTECDELLLSGISAPQRGELSRYLDKFELEAVETYAQHSLFDDVERGLMELSKHFELYVVSNCGVQYLEIFKQNTAVGTLFRDSECFGRNHLPKHANISAVVKRNSISVPCYIGDTAGDEAAAAQAGVPFFHAAYGFGKPVNAPVAFPDFSALVNYFLGGKTVGESHHTSMPRNISPSS